MNTQPVKITISDLQSKYREIENEKNQVQFFIKTADYGKYILKNKTCRHILVDSLHEDNQNDTKAYKGAFKQFFDEWKVYAKDIIKQAQKANIQDDLTKLTFSEIEQIKSLLKKGEIYLYKSDVGEYYINYWKLIRRFNDSDKSSLLIPKHFESVESPLRISNLYKNAEDEWNRFKQLREITVWWAHCQIEMLATGVLNMEERKEYMSENEVNRFYQFEFNEVARGNLSSIPIVLHYNKYVVWIKRLHEYLLPRLENYEENDYKNKIRTANFSQKSQALFDKDISKIKLLGKEIPIPKNTNQFELCKLIFQDQVSREKEWSYDEVLEEWGKNYEGKDVWRKVYNAAREINQKVAAKTAIENLLLAKPYSTQLNPQFI